MSNSRPLTSNEIVGYLIEGASGASFLRQYKCEADGLASHLLPQPSKVTPLVRGSHETGEGVCKEALGRIAAGTYTESGAEQHAKDILKALGMLEAPAQKALDDRDPTPEHLLKQGYRSGKVGDK